MYFRDNLPHIPDSQLSPRKAFAGIRAMTDLLQATFPNTSFYPTIGNHDSYPSNLVPPSDDEQYYSQMAEDAGWNLMLDEDSLKTFKTGGYYSSKNSAGLQVVGLNTMLWFTRNTLIRNLTDPAGQFAWLESELENLQSKNAKVLVIAHIPPGYSAYGGNGYWSPSHNRRFLNLLQQYADIIVALILGHEHVDRFHIVYNKKGVPILPAFVAPAITPHNNSIPGHNPGVRLYKYSRQTGHILDFTQYYLNLSAANLRQHADWLVEYTATEAYGIHNIEAESLNYLVDTFRNSSSDNFGKYWLYRTVSSDAKSNCTGKCKRRALCAITCLDFDWYAQCLKSETFRVQHMFSGPTAGHSQGVKSQFISILIATLVSGAIVAVIVATSVCYHKRKSQQRYSLLSSGETQTTTVEL